MIDTISILFNDEAMDNINLINTSNFNNYSQQRFESGLITTNGNLKNMRISFNSNYLKIQGSLCKYYKGENQSTLTHKEIVDAIELLGEELEIPIWFGKLSRIDIGENFIMSLPASSYYNRLAKASKYRNRLEQSSGLYYTNGKNCRKKIVFYDKTKEQGKNQVIPLYCNKNLLRYEVCLMKELDKILNTSDLLVSNLKEQSFYQQLVTIWYDEFKSIQKCRDVISFQDNVLYSTKKFKTQLAVLGMNSIGGYGEVLKIVEQGKREKKFESGKQKMDLMKMLKDLNETTCLTIKNDLIMELEEKIEEVAKNILPPSMYIKQAS